jgi:hypothetical protein
MVEHADPCASKDFVVRLIARLIVNMPKEYTGAVCPQHVVDVAHLIQSGRVAHSAANVIFKELHERKEST